MPYKPQFISGMCRCGHPFDDHHLGMILNEDIFKQLPAGHPPYYAQECEAYGCNETGGLGPDGEPHCGHYIDRDSPDARTDTSRGTYTRWARVKAHIRSRLASWRVGPAP